MMYYRVSGFLSSCSDKKVISALLTWSVILLSFFLTNSAMSFENPATYQVISSNEEVEIRQYEPIIVGWVNIKREHEDVVNKGFPILFKYISGNNSTEQKLEMTAPVLQEGNGEKWRLGFIIPAQYTIETVPKPNDDRLKIELIPSKKLISLKFSGGNTNRNMNRHQEILAEYIEANNIKTVGNFTFAYYDAPWTLPFLRHNEVLIEIEN